MTWHLLVCFLSIIVCFCSLFGLSALLCIFVPCSTLNASSCAFVSYLTLSESLCVSIFCLALVHYHVFLFLTQSQCITMFLCSLVDPHISCLSCHCNYNPLKTSNTSTCLVIKSQKGMVLLVTILQIMMMFLSIPFVVEPHSDIVYQVLTYKKISYWPKRMCTRLK
jgi:hypothetical protein